MLDVVRAPLAFGIAVEPRVRNCSVPAPPKLCRESVDVRIEFDAVIQDVLRDEGIVAESPITSIPLGVFLIDWDASANIMLLMTFIDVPVVSGVVIPAARRKVPEVTVLSTVTGPTNPDEVNILIVSAVI